jgi:cardiolipin synthase C
MTTDAGRTRQRYWLVVLVLLNAACVTTLPASRVPASYVLPAEETAGTLVGRYVIGELAGQPAGASGFHLVVDGRSALAARLELIDLAERSLDLQYYIYQGDITGSLVAERLLAAADRGVRVRLLLDDMGAGLGDIKVATLGLHSRIEIRLFNPVTLRQKWLRFLSQIGEFGRINYRMHNKLMVVDGQLMITGGRNIGDEYFTLRELDFQDVDVLAIGGVSVDAAVGFDTYWNSAKSIPIEQVSRFRGSARDLERLRRRLGRLRTREKQQPYLTAVAAAPIAGALRARQVEWHWGTAEWLEDPPEKADPRSEVNRVPHLGNRLEAHFEGVEHELLIVSAYFIPGKDGVRMLERLAQRGVTVGVLTNSLATTDVVAVHSGYARYREPLLSGGVGLWELRPVSTLERGSGLGGESIASLHAKAFVFDREKLFIGSINLDPRSLHLNTESGVMIRQTELAGEAVALFEHWTSDAFAFRLNRSESGTVEWHADGRQRRPEPDAGRARRLLNRLLGWLPIESQL